MTFQVIPAIDVAGGRLARLSPDGPLTIDAYGGDPVAAARACLEAGAAFVHVVDMDLAFTGEARNTGVLRSIAGLGARVQAAGAIVADGEIAAALDAGSERVVLGSGALHDLAEAGRLIQRYGERLVVGSRSRAIASVRAGAGAPTFRSSRRWRRSTLRAPLDV